MFPCIFWNFLSSIKHCFFHNDVFVVICLLLALSISSFPLMITIVFLDSNISTLSHQTKLFQCCTFPIQMSYKIWAKTVILLWMGFSIKCFLILITEAYFIYYCENAIVYNHVIVKLLEIVSMIMNVLSMNNQSRITQHFLTSLKYRYSM